MTNNGKDYEQFVANLHKSLLDSEPLGLHKNIKIELNKKIHDNSGNIREFDLYWEYELAGITYKTIIECKDYNSYISVEKIDALIGKIRDIPDLKPVFATKKGYQRGAQKKAQQNRIELLIVREQNNTDWEGKIREICINLHIQSPAKIISFDPRINGIWVKENTQIDISKPFRLNDMTNRIIIEDLDANAIYSLYDLEQKLAPFGNNQAGNFIKEETFKNAFLICEELKLKLDSYKIEYSIAETIKIPLNIDFSKELLGVIEYIQRGNKKLVFKEGHIKEEKI